MPNLLAIIKFTTIEYQLSLFQWIYSKLHKMFINQQRFGKNSKALDKEKFQSLKNKVKVEAKKPNRAV